MDVEGGVVGIGHVQKEVQHRVGGSGTGAWTQETPTSLSLLRHLNVHMYNLERGLLPPLLICLTVGAVYIYVRAHLTQSGLHRVNNMSKALGVERVGINTAVKARVDPQHCVVEDL